jgi:hypothetical protein
MTSPIRMFFNHRIEISGRYTEIGTLRARSSIRDLVLEDE